ncbi:MAG: ABC transporter permease subunit [Lachnospiraceae bacterium]|nr:ABC transporter permease subunit [Lachnospiraceae bacterium]
MRLLSLEIKRILKSKITWVLLLCSLIFAVLMAYLPVTFEGAIIADPDGNEREISGLKAVQYFQEMDELFGEVTTEKLRQTVERYQEVYEVYDSQYGNEVPAAVFYAELAKYRPFIRGVKEVFANPETGIAAGVRDLDIDRIEDYYEMLPKRLISIMDMEQKNYPSAKEAALGKFKRVNRPYRYYYGASGNSMDYETLFIFLMTLLGVIITATVFSSDYQTKADDILRCTKHGRLRIAGIKVLAAFLITGSSYLICGIVWILVTNTLFGWEGTRTSMQLIFSVTSLVPFTIGQLQWVNLLGGFILFLATISFTLFLSARARDNVSALALGLTFALLPVIVYMSVPGALGDWLSCILPSGGIGLGNSILYSMYDFIFLHIGRASFWNADVLLILGVIKIPVFAWGAISSYCRRYA